MIFDELERRIASGLADGPPGSRGQLPMSPRPRFGWRPDRVPEGARRGSVLLLLFPVAGRAHLLLTKRASRLTQHAGQISLPGGAVESGETEQLAALRESHEEVGLDPSTVRIRGRLSTLDVPVSGFVLQPFIGTVPSRPNLVADHKEVERILEVPLERLFDPAAQSVETRTRRGEPVEVPYFDLGTDKLWGATAMVVSELLTVLDREPDPWSD